MAISLVDALSETLADWQEDLPRSWRELFDDLELGFLSVDPKLQLYPWEPIFPTRRNHPIPGAPAGAHMFRAFDGIEPGEVRCVILGQDPYPCPAFATGRAFEAGGYATWRELEKMPSPSMRSLIQCICAFRANDDDYVDGIQNWSYTLRSIESGRVQVPPPSLLARHWVQQGVLLLNSSLTISRFSVTGDPHQAAGHVPLWRPLIVRTIRYFAARKPNPPVFILLGDVAKSALAEAGMTERHPGIVATAHPATGDKFLAGNNPFKACNQKLIALRLDPIAW